MQTKSDLIVQLSNGDPNAFRDLFNILYPRMLAYCALFVNDKSQAEDLVQDCFIKLWNVRGSLKADGNVEKLLFVMLRNFCLNYLRDHKEKESLQDLNIREVSELQQLYNIDFLGGEDCQIEELLISSLKEAVEKLPGRQKEVLQKTRFKGQSQKEVAADLGISVKAVEKNVASAKKKIKEELMRKFPKFWIIFIILLPLIWK